MKTLRGWLFTWVQNSREKSSSLGAKGHRIMDWFQIGKGVCQDCILPSSLFNFYAEYIMWNAGWIKHKLESRLLGEISITRYADTTTLMEESEEELKSLMMKVKEEGKKFGLKINIQKTKIMASSPITSWQINGETVERVMTLFSWAPKSLQMVTAAMK